MVLSLRILGACSIAATLAACAGEVSFDSPDSAARLRAIHRAAENDDRTAIPKLIEMLDSDDSAVRIMAFLTLQSMTGQSLGYDPVAPSYERTPAVNRWQEWYTAQLGHTESAHTNQNTNNAPASVADAAASDPIPPGNRNNRNRQGSPPDPASPHADDAGSTE